MIHSFTKWLSEDFEVSNFMRLDSQHERSFPESKDRELCVEMLLSMSSHTPQNPALTFCKPVVSSMMISYPLTDELRHDVGAKSALEFHCMQFWTDQSLPYF